MGVPGWSSDTTNRKTIVPTFNMSEEYDTLHLRSRTITETMSKVTDFGQDNKEETEKRDSKSGSKDNLDDSNMPLLENEEKAEKNDDKSEKNIKEKKVKVKKEPATSCINTNSRGLNMEARDSQGINDEINLDFDDILAEPTSSHGFDPV